MIHDLLVGASYLVTGGSLIVGVAILVTLLDYEFNKSESMRDYERRLEREQLEREDRHANRKAS